MKKKLIETLFLNFLLVACHQGTKQLPKITAQDIKNAQALEQTFQNEILEGELVSALENEGDLSQRGFIVDGIIKKLIEMALPIHLEGFNENHWGLNNKTDRFAEYKGVFGQCHQFRVFYKYNDSRVENVQWASSVLSVPSRHNTSINAGVVLAPTLDGFSPLIESGLWLKLCRKGLATLMPESLYRERSENKWEKLHFDPTPQYKKIDEYTLYEESIQRYEKLLNMNIEILRSLDRLFTERNDKLTDLDIMSVNPTRVGFWGSSFGAVVGSLVVSKDPKIKAAVLTVGGGDLPFVVSRSSISLFKNTRKEQMKLLGMTRLEDYETFISQYIKSDPLNYAKKSDGNRIYMVLADKDTSVPTKAQYELYEKLGQPKNRRINGGHILTLLFMSWFNSGTSRESIDDLIEKLNKD